MNSLFTTEKPEKNKLVTEFLEKDGIVFENRVVEDYLYSCKNNGKIIIKDRESKEVIEKEMYLSDTGFEYFNSVCETKILKKLSELFTEEYRNAEIGGYWHKEYFPKVLLPEILKKHKKLEKELPREKKQGMCR